MANHTTTKQEKEVVWLEFFKNKMGIAALLISLVILFAVLWFCLFGFSREETKDGTLVQMIPWQEEVMVCRETA